MSRVSWATTSIVTTQLFLAKATQARWPSGDSATEVGARSTDDRGAGSKKRTPAVASAASLPSNAENGMGETSPWGSMNSAPAGGTSTSVT